MTGLYCDICGGNVYEDIDGICYCDTCGCVKYPDGTVITINDDEN